jgi:two-component system LytT family response regulator
VDDEPMARERILGLLAQEIDVEVVGQCADGVQAVNAIQQLSPELVFLDVQMPAVDGFGVIRQVGPEKMPMVVFVTAYDEYALQAFEVHALDYLLKPFGATGCSSASTTRAISANASARASWARACWRSSRTSSRSRRSRIAWS